eukprot:CAMPEP_0201516186 /NCGR_PEP_ID=MMETSP0161_2-20130828/7572_1 /ASSEMBLY_ACC=CAM_ASM_000251 /TAXON_ID=180227 /ORGANISM="Neoparamoeba aestuarina, Strain SoJaBio B1-5/56/2" /LENGTH=129 /DNA_ID=CAMNT_0047913223 /DNA_START=523 /DNA_END=912 /DNA_ORIENTATION=+
MEKKKKDAAVLQLSMALQMHADKFNFNFYDNNDKIVTDVNNFYSIVKKIKSFCCDGNDKGGSTSHFVAQIGKGIDHQYRVGLLSACSGAVGKALGEGDEEEKHRLRVIIHESCALLEALLTSYLGKKTK